MNPNENSDQAARQASALGDALAHAANETLILARLEEFISPKPAQLAKTDAEAHALDAQVDRVIALYGGVPRFFIQGINDPKPKYDTYMSDAIDEAIEVFKRARRSLCRAQSFMIGANLLKVNPEALGLSDDEKSSQLLQTSVESVFWEHTETSFIRLAGYWDRVGQMLDFAFFSIRQYERDGFSAVVDRIRANALKMQPNLEKSPSWQAIWNYKKSDREDGLQWLLSRRNLLVHSLYLRATDDMEENDIFESAFNHLDDRRRRTLSPGSPEKEIERLHAHLAHAAELLPHIFTLCEMNARKLA